MLSITPSVQSPRAYDLGNLHREGLRTRLADEGYRYRIHPAELDIELTEDDLVFGFPPGHLSRYNAVGDGVANDKDAINLAFAASKTVIFPRGTYYVGQLANSSDVAIELAGLGAGITIITEGDVEIVCETTADVIASVFRLKDNSHFRCGPIRFRDTGYDADTAWRGACAFRLDCDEEMSWGDVAFDAIFSKNMVQSICCGPMVTPNWDDRIRGIRVGLLYSDDSFYGVNCQNQGDGLVVGKLVAIRNYRPYYVYGVTEHNVNILALDNRATSGAVNIARSPGGLDTSSIRVNYTSRQTAVTLTHVNINHIDLLGGVISNIVVNVNIEGSAAYDPINFINYTEAGGSPTGDPSDNYVRDVQITGTCDANAAPVAAIASYAAAGRLSFRAGENLSLHTSALEAFALSDESAPALTWSATSVDPALGDGTLACRLNIADGVVHAHVALTIGSTTTTGTGSWGFALPYRPQATAVGSCWMFDNGTAYYVGVAKIEAGDNIVRIYANFTGSGVGAAQPFTWVAGDQLVFSLSYRQATG